MIFKLINNQQSFSLVLCYFIYTVYYDVNFECFYVRKHSMIHFENLRSK